MVFDMKIDPNNTLKALENFDSSKHLVTRDLKLVQKSGFRRIERFFRPHKYDPRAVAKQIIDLAAKVGTETIKANEGVTKLSKKFSGHKRSIRVLSRSGRSALTKLGQAGYALKRIQQVTSGFFQEQELTDTKVKALRTQKNPSYRHAAEKYAHDAFKDYMRIEHARYVLNELHAHEGAVIGKGYVYLDKEDLFKEAFEAALTDCHNIIHIDHQVGHTVDVTDDSFHASLMRAAQAEYKQVKDVVVEALYGDVSLVLPEITNKGLLKYAADKLGVKQPEQVAKREPYACRDAKASKILRDEELSYQRLAAQEVARIRAQAARQHHSGSSFGRRAENMHFGDMKS